MHLFILNFLLTVNSAGAMQPADWNNISAGNPGYKKTEIPFLYKNGLLIVNVKINNVPLKFIFDTGAEHTILLNKEIAGLLRLNILKSIDVYGADFNKKVKAYITSVVNVNLGGKYKKDIQMLVLEEDVLALSNDRYNTIHGILGSSFFSGTAIKIDYKKQKLTVYGDENYSTKGFRQLPAFFDRHRPLIKAKITTGTTDSLKYVNLLMDTGSSVPLILLSSLDSLQKMNIKIIRGKIGTGIGGDLEGWISTVKTLCLGQYCFSNLICKFQELDSIKTETLSKFRNGLTGNGLLEHFDIIIDYRKEKVFAKARHKRLKNPGYDKSGLTLVAGGKNLNRYFIKHVIPGSPADKAGLKPGDEIYSVQCLHRVFWSLERIVKLLKKHEGKRIKMKIIRNGKKIKVSFRLKDMFKD